MKFYAKVLRYSQKLWSSLFLINMTKITKILDLFRIIMLECVDEGGEDEDAHGKEESEHTKLFVAVLYCKLKSLR